MITSINIHVISVLSDGKEFVVDASWVKPDKNHDLFTIAEAFRSEVENQTGLKDLTVKIYAYHNQYFYEIKSWS